MHSCSRKLFQACGLERLCSVGKHAVGEVPTSASVASMTQNPVHSNYVLLVKVRELESIVSVPLSSSPAVRLETETSVPVSGSLAVDSEERI